MIPNKTAGELIAELKDAASLETLSGQQRFGIHGRNMLGVSMYEVRRICKGFHDHWLAQELWVSGIHEARIMAALVDIPAMVTYEQMNEWVEEFDSWDLCDQVTTSLFDLTPFAQGIVYEWAKREPEFVRRAAFSTIAGLAWHNKKMTDQEFTDYFELIRDYSTDPRNFVKKAVNWALRNIGKRNPILLEECTRFATELHQSEDRTTRWIAADALREFEKRRAKLS